MSSDWDLLGIDPTSDATTIKRAYAKALRTCPPETDPEGFQRLRSAYERLLEATKQPRSTPDFPTPRRPPQASDVPPPSRQPASWRPKPETPPPAPQPAQPQRDLDVQWAQLWNSDKISEIAAWKAFLDGPQWWDLARRRALENTLLDQIQTHWLNSELDTVPPDAWYLLDIQFAWLEREPELIQTYNAHFVRELLELVRQNCERNDPVRYPATTTMARKKSPRRPRRGDPQRSPLNDEDETSESAPRDWGAPGQSQPGDNWDVSRYAVWFFLAIALFALGLCRNPEDNLPWQPTTRVLR